MEIKRFCKSKQSITFVYYLNPSKVKENKMKRTKYFVLWVVFGCLATNLTAGPTDSIGTKVRNGKIYIVHEVDKGTGIFTIAKRYGISMDAITQENPAVAKGIFAGQILLIPTGKNAPFEEPVVKEYFHNEKKEEAPEKKDERSTFGQYHTVVLGETLFKIAQKYQTNVQVIKDLNNLTSNEIAPGMKLLVPANGQKIEEIPAPQEKVQEKVEEKVVKEEKVEKEVAKTIKEEKPQNEPTPEIQEIKKQYSEVKQEVKEGDMAPAKPKYFKKVENLPEFDVEKVTESGRVVVLGSEKADVSRNLACHYEAEENTIIMVTNPSNSKSIFVKVVCKSEIDPKDGTIIELTPAALAQIGLKEGEVVEISYAR